MSTGSKHIDPIILGEASWGVDYLLETYPPHWLDLNKKLIYDISKPRELDKNNEIKEKRFLEQEKLVLMTQGAFNFYFCGILGFDWGFKINHELEI